MKFHLAIILFSCLLFNSCQPTKTTIKVPSIHDYEITFLDTNAAKKAITTDEAEGFFENIRLMDMKVQMKSDTFEDLRLARISYKKHLEESVLPFTEIEITKIEIVLNKVFKMCQQTAPDVFPLKLNFIKTNMNHYGASVFYSRENNIVIPKNMLRKQLDEAFTKSILKEIFHIYLRQKYWKRVELHQLIGFYEIPELEIPEPLNNKLLINPNGVNYKYVIRNLGDINDPFYDAVPLIYMPDNQQYRSRSLSFYSNLEFSLYKVKGEEVIMNEDGSSTVDMKTIQNFYEQISRNSLYIIHPNEILADNFAILAFWKSGKRTLLESSIDNEGKMLLLEMEKILNKPN
jgi:hypothetical protein